MIDLFTAAQADDSIRCILVRGAGKIFSAGGDVGNFAKSLDQPTEVRQADFRERLQRVEKMVAAVLAFDRPIVACINGPAAGAGLLYALAADVVIGDQTS